MKLKRLIGVMVIAGLTAPGLALATNGYFSHGYGMKAKGMGGASTAVMGDTFGGANNPAGMVWAGDRADLGVDLFSPIREASRQGSGTPFDVSVDSDSNYFLVPEFGYNRMLGWNMSVGVTVYGNGGMNTDYPGGQIPAGVCFGSPTPSNILCGNGKLGVDLMQLVIAPTFSMKINKDHSFGISPLIGYQRFKVDGLQAFMGISSSSANTTNRGYDSAHGFGVRFGWMGKVSDRVTLGAAYSSKIRMSEFGKYKGLFAEKGDFDIPENYNIGIAFKATPALTIAADIQQINYGDVKSVANGVTPSLMNPACPLGASCGSGFKWRDQTVFKLGAEYAYSNNLTLRAGYNYGKTPIRSGTTDDVTFNIIAPGVVEKHLTLGATWTLANKDEITLSYMHAFSKSVTGPSAFQLFGLPGTTTETLKMHQNSLGIAYGWKFQ